MIRKYVLMALGTFCLALSSGLFIIPGNILSGGVAGISVAISPLIPNVPKEYISSFLMLLMFVLGAIFMGRDFTLKTLVSSILYPPMLIMVTKLIKPFEIDPILASVYGGLLGGVGIGIVFRQGGSTGGMDLPPLLMNKFLGIKVNVGVLITDGLSVLLGLINYGIPQVLIGFVAVYCTSKGCEKVISYGGAKSKEIKIISDNYLEIAEEIHHVIDRGTTILDGEGGYTHEKRKVLMSVVGDNEYQKVLDAVNRIDSRAFVVVTDIKDVHGEGFTYAYRI